jgi:hypothetical protein
MKFTCQYFKEEDDHRVESFLRSLTLEFPSIEQARELFRKGADLDKVPAHSFTIKSEDGKISERWFQMDGSWRRREARQP